MAVDQVLLNALGVAVASGAGYIVADGVVVEDGALAEVSGA